MSLTSLKKNRESRPQEFLIWYLQWWEGWGPEGGEGVKRKREREKKKEKCTKKV